ncbi:MAG: sortase [Hellea sp.]|nr:sortase [Hellea sp.]
MILRRLIVAFVGLLGISLFVWGNWIQMKSIVAGVWLDRAWEQSLNQSAPQELWSTMDARTFAELSLDRLNVKEVVLDRATGQALAFAPAFLEDSYLPGQGMTAIAAHKNTHFAFLEHAVPGDVIELQNVAGDIYTYKVEQGFVLDTRVQDLSISGNKDGLLLITCYPFDSLSFNGPMRYIVRAETIN